MKIVKQQFKYPDKKGGEEVYYFETSTDQIVDEKGNKLPQVIQTINQTIVQNRNDLEIALNNESTLRAFQDDLQLPNQVDLTLQKTKWVLDSSETSEYKYYNDVSVGGLTPKDVGWIDFSLGTYALVLEAGVAMKAKSFEGKVRLYAIEIPTGNIDMTFTFFKGRE